MSTVREALVVMKFGGTSVEDAVAMRRTAAIVAGRRKLGLSAVVVVSAMAKVTDLLIASGAAAGRGDRKGALAISERLRTRHIDTTAQLLQRRSICEAATGHRSRVRRARRSAARHRRGGGVDSAHSGPRSQLRGAAFQPHRRGGIRPARFEWRACGCPDLRHHRQHLWKSGPSGRRD